MAATAEERISTLTRSEDIFSLAVPFVACSENRIGTNALEGKKPHQGIFSKNRTIAVGAMWAKWSETHQDRSGWWSKTVLGIAIDANGNTLSNPSGKQYTWDFENRLTQVVNPGVGTSTFRYDPFGRRIQKSGPLGTTNYVYDVNSLVEEIDQSGNALARYTQTMGIDDPLAELRSGTTTYYQSDGTKSITSLTDPASAIVGTYTYDAFGNLSASTGSLTNPFRYTGRELDSETGLYYYRTRYYDSGIGRFTSEDLVRFKGGINFYPYVRNRPATFGDPMGTCLWQFDSVTTTLGQCKDQPNKNLQCECLCEPIGINHQECVDDCKKGCLSPKLDPVEACSCLCDKRHENGSLNWVETKLCKYFCKKGGK
jgi:RHS repeat-associated protein